MWQSPLSGGTKHYDTIDFTQPFRIFWPSHSAFHTSPQLKKCSAGNTGHALGTPTVSTITLTLRDHQKLCSLLFLSVEPLRFSQTGPQTNPTIGKCSQVGKQCRSPIHLGRALLSLNFSSSTSHFHSSVISAMI